MRRTRIVRVAGLLGGLVASSVVIAFWSGIAYVTVHFIAKFW